MKFSRIPTALLGASLTTTLAQNSTNTSSTNVMFKLSNDTEFAFYLETVLSLANGGGSATGEVLRAASQIIGGDFESFYSEFKYLADALHAVGTNGTRHAAAKRDAFFRSAAYYRAADFFLHGNWSDPRVDSLWESQLADFDAAIALLKPAPGVRINISTAEGFDVPLIFYSPGNDTAEGRFSASSSGRPTVLAGSGYDGPQEDLWHDIGVHVVARGWNFVTYEGPGQPTVRRQQGLGFRPDWWTVVTPVVDYLVSRDDVDADRIALEGVSFGGTLAPRAASREHRFAALLCMDGLYSLFDGLTAQFPTTLLELFESGNQTLFDYYVNVARAKSTTETSFRWLVDQGTWAFNTTSPFEWLTALKEYNLDGILGNITMPVFVGSGENDAVAPGQPEEVAQILGSRATYHKFLDALGAGEHCQIGAEQQLAQVSLDWLEDVFANVGKNSSTSTL